MTFGERLATARKDKGLTQEALGKGLGTNGADAGKQVVLGWEKGRHYPKVDQLAVICDRLQVSADELVLGRVGAWPFTAELRAAVEKLPPPELGFLENAMRAHLRLGPIDYDRELIVEPSVRTNPMETNGLETSTSVAGTTSSPDTGNSSSVIQKAQRVRTGGASSSTGKVQEQRGRGPGKRTA